MPNEPLSRWMLYGANGFTGRLIAAEAVSRGLKPILAGRSRTSIGPLAVESFCPHRVFSLSNVESIVRRLQDVALVLNCAGPFSRTAPTMIDACLRAGVHYLDITGEIDVIEWAARHRQHAASRRIILMPAVGFDVVPSDCLSALLAQALPSATHLQLAFTGIWPISPGTAQTVWQQAGQGGRVRIDGRIVRVPTAWKVLDVPFPSAARQAITFPWGDVATAYYTTAIPNIEVYVALPPTQIKLIRRWRWMEGLARVAMIQSLGRWWIQRSVRGPDADQRGAGRSEFWGRAWDDKGQSAEATLETPEGYSLTVQAALLCVQRVLEGQLGTGFWTPGKALGSGLLHDLPGVRAQWRRRPNDKLGIGSALIP